MSLKVVMGGMRPSSSTNANISSGAIHRVDPAKKDVAKTMLSVMSSTTFERPKSVIMGFPYLSTNMLPCFGKKKISFQTP